MSSVKIIGKEGEYLQITDLDGKYKTQIHESIITDNNYEVIDDLIKVSEDSFNYWFKKDIQEEAKRIRDEKFNLFYPNIPLFWKNREMILKEPNYYSIFAPEHFYGMMYMMVGNPRVTLGELLQIWKNEEVFSVVCKSCGGKSVVYRFGGSPLSGSIFEKKTICLQCGKVDNPPKNGSLGQMRRARENYSPIEPIAKPPASLQELVAICKGDVDEICNCKTTPKVVNDFGQPLVRIGNKTLTTEQFTNLLTPKDNKKTE